MRRDARGNPVSTASAAALDASEQALWRMMSFYGTPIDDLDAAIAADAHWMLPRLMKAGFLLSLTEPSLHDDARKLLGDAEPLLAIATRRELDHLSALQALAEGDWDMACTAWDRLLLAHPRDPLALQWAHLFDFYRGDSQALRQRGARTLPEWKAEDPLYPYVLGLYAFGLEETNFHVEAESAGRAALAGEARVPWAIHAVAHVMDMQGRHEEGAAWLAQWRPHWAEGNGFTCHLAWHEALFALEACDHAAALRVFDTYLHPKATEITLQRVDAASLLWRLDLQGADVGDRWRALVADWHLDFRHAGHSTFNDTHALLALLGLGDMPRAAAWLRTALARAADRGGPNAAVARDVGEPLMEGLLAFARGDHDVAVATLYPIRAQAQRFGGSHAQRDLIDQTLLAASARGREKNVGRALLNERKLAKRMTPLTEHWARALGLAAS
ncbi:MAG: tetratricopeptide repeat protein [Caldimonas sp.]